MAIKTIDKKDTVTGSRTIDTILNRIRGAFATKDEKEMEAGLEELKEAKSGDNEGGSAVHIHLPGGAEVAPPAGDAEVAAAPGGGLEERMAAVEAMMVQIGPALEKLLNGGGGAAAPGDDLEELEDGVEVTDDDIKEEVKSELTGDTSKVRVTTKDSTALVESFQDVLARAEILVPGVSVPTFDAKAKAGDTLKQMCDFRRNTLKQAIKTADGKKAVTMLVNDTASLDKMPCNALRLVFNGAAELARAANNQAARSPGRTGDARPGSTVKVPSLAEMNEKYRKHYGQPVR